LGEQPVHGETKQTGELGSDSSGWSIFSVQSTVELEQALLCSFAETVKSSQRFVEFACEASSFICCPSEGFEEIIKLRGGSLRASSFISGLQDGRSGVLSLSVMNLV
jgi:hypothetical protein